MALEMLIENLQEKILHLLNFRSSQILVSSFLLVIGSGALSIRYTSRSTSPSKIAPLFLTDFEAFFC